MISEILKRPAYTLTAGELVDLIVERISVPKQSTIEKPKERTRINGIKGLANYLQCSMATAQKLKNEGRFPHYNIGSKVFFFAEEINLNNTTQKD